MKRPKLNEIPIPEEVNRHFPECVPVVNSVLRLGTPYIIREGQWEWDVEIKGVYESGQVILELDEDQMIIHIYRRPYC
jgi:hypothetical protein